MRYFALIDMGFLFVMMGLYLALAFAVQGKPILGKRPTFTTARERALNYYRTLAFWGELPLLPAAVITLAVFIPVGTAMWFSFMRDGLAVYPEMLAPCLSEMPIAYGTSFGVTAFMIGMQWYWAAAARRYL